VRKKGRLINFLPAQARRSNVSHKLLATRAINVTCYAPRAPHREL